MRFAASVFLIFTQLLLGCGSSNSAMPDAIDAHWDPSPTDLACQDYCSTLLQNCTNENQIFATDEACMDACLALPIGNYEDTTGNSIVCRTHYANLASSEDPEINCAKAAIASQDETCGTLCEAYCDQIEHHCTDDNLVFENRGSCAAACQDMARGEWNDKTGNSIQCRTYQAIQAGVETPELYCPRASVTSSDNACGTVCDAYCDHAMGNCTGDNELFATRPDCEAACSGYPVGEWDDTTGNTAQCRTYHASFPADGNPALSCPQAAPSGGTVCN